jgi:malate permease and related proteins
MLAQWLTTISAVISVFTVIAVGVAARRGGWLSEEADQSLMKLIMGLLFPCLIFSAVSNNPALREPENLVWAPAVGAASIGLGLIVAALAMRLGPGLHGLHTRGQQRTFVLAVAFFNYAFVPIPLIELLFDEDTLGVMFVHNVGAGLLAYSLGISIMSDTMGRRWWMRMLNGPTIATAIALIANWTGLGAMVAERLLFLDTAVRWLGQASVPISLLAIGAVTADQLGPSGSDITGLASTRMIVTSCVLRLFVLPVVGLTAATYLPISDPLRQVMVIMAAMPAGTFVIILARHYGGVPGVAMRVALSTSLLSLATIPLWIAIGLRVTGLAAGF